MILGGSVERLEMRTLIFRSMRRIGVTSWNVEQTPWISASREVELPDLNYRRGMSVRRDRRTRGKNFSSNTESNDLSLFAINGNENYFLA